MADRKARVGIGRERVVVELPRPGGEEVDAFAIELRRLLNAGGDPRLDGNPAAQAMAELVGDAAALQFLHLVRLREVEASMDRAAASVQGLVERLPAAAPDPGRAVDDVLARFRELGLPIPNLGGR